MPLRCASALFLLPAIALFAQSDRPKTYNEASSAWFKSHPQPSANASPEELQSYYREEDKASAEWVALWPHDMAAWLERLHVLDKVKSTSDQQLEETGETLLRVAKENPIRGFRFNPYQTDVAMSWTMRHLRPEQCLALTQEAARADEQMQLNNPSFTRQFLEVIAQGFLTTLDLEISLARQLDKTAVVASALAEMKRFIETHPSLPARQKARYYLAAALFAGEQGRKPDALLYYSQVMHLVGDDFQTDPSPEAHVRQLWKELGGSDDGLGAWLSNFSKPDPAAAVNKVADPLWTPFDKPLTTFHGADSNGHLWTIDDLRGKRTLIVVWASWCRPCHEELPTVQQLFDNYKNLTDTQVLTVSVDENATAIRPVMEQKHYTFPVLFINQKEIDAMAGFSGVPRTWIVDSNGVIRLEAVGYSADLTYRQIARQLALAK